MSQKTAGPRMALEEFRATGRDVPDLCAPEVGSLDEDEVRPGRVYVHRLYIEQADHKDGKWLLTLANQQWLSDDLARLEGLLYEWGRTECDLDAKT